MYSLCCGMRSSCSPASAAGETYSGVGALSLLGRLPRKWQSPAKGKTMSPEFVDNMTRWLVARQTLMLQEDGEDLSIDDDSVYPLSVPGAASDVFRPTFHVIGAFPVSLAHPSQPLPEVSLYERQWVGVNGRCNKVADTCYSFWVGGTLGVSRCYATLSNCLVRFRTESSYQILNKVYLQDFNGIRRYLLEKTQHIIGGFGKMPGDPPGELSTLGLLEFNSSKRIMANRHITLSSRSHYVGCHARDGFEKYRSYPLCQCERKREIRTANCCRRSRLEGQFYH